MLASKASTMTTVVMLKALVCIIGIVLVYAEYQNSDGLTDNFCCLGYNNTHFNVKTSGVYIIANFCGVKFSNIVILPVEEEDTEETRWKC